MIMTCSSSSSCCCNNNNNSSSSSKNHHMFRFHVIVTARSDYDTAVYISIISNSIV